MKYLLLILGLVIPPTVAGKAAYACTCLRIKGTIVVTNDNPPVKPDSATSKTGVSDEYTVALFIGQVVKIEKVKVKKFDTSRSMNKVAVKVEKYWTGVKAPEIVIYTAIGNGSCGVSYKNDKSYFFWAARDGGFLETGACSPKNVDNELIPVLNEVLGAAKAFP